VAEDAPLLYAAVLAAVLVISASGIDRQAAVKFVGQLDDLPAGCPDGADVTRGIAGASQRQWHDELR
jgi:hypothetical protein